MSRWLVRGVCVCVLHSMCVYATCTVSLGTSGGLTDYLSTSKLEGSLSLFHSSFSWVTHRLFSAALKVTATLKVWKARDTKSSVVRQHFSTPLLILNCTRASVKAVNYQIVSPLHDTAGGIMGKNYSLLIKCQICCCTTALQMFWPCYFMLFCSHPVFTQTASNSAFNKNKSVPYCHKL